MRCLGLGLQGRAAEVCTSSAKIEGNLFPQAPSRCMFAALISAFSVLFGSNTRETAEAFGAWTVTDIPSSHVEIDPEILNPEVSGSGRRALYR